MKKILPFLLAIVLLIAQSAILSGCEMSGASATPTPTTEAAGQGHLLPGGLLVAEAQVVPVRSVTLSFAGTGLITEVLVKEGETVKKDQVIARLEGRERLQSTLSSAEVALLDSQQRLDKLSKDADLKVADSQKIVAEAELALKKANDALLSKDLQVATQAQIDAAWAEYILALEEVKDAQEEYDKVKDRQENEYAHADALHRLARAKDLREKSWDRWDKLVKGPKQVDIAISQARQVVAQASAQKAQEDYKELQNGIDPDDLALAQASLKNAKVQVEAARKSLEDLELKAPFDGTIILNTFKVGESAVAGVSYATLADISSWEIETTDLTELQVVKVRLNQPVIVTFDAIPNLQLEGKVKEIKSLGVNKQGDITYTVVVNLNDQDERLLWKMTAFVNFME